MKDSGRNAALAVTGIAAIGLLGFAIHNRTNADQSVGLQAASARHCDPANGGITLPPGFCATVFADKIGHARHIVVSPAGVVYINTWSGEYYAAEPPRKTPFLTALKDTDGDGHADVVRTFGDGVGQGSAGGTGIRLFKGYLYAEVNDRIVRYGLQGGSIAPSRAPETIVSGLPTTGEHPMHPFIIKPDGTMLVNVGSATNVCEVKKGDPLSGGSKPCAELATRAGLWRFDANRVGQKFSAAERYVTGLRNSGGQTLDDAGNVIAVQHGRDMLQAWKAIFPGKQGAYLPAEEMVRIEKGKDYGWPQCYYDGFQKKLVLAPEYGGDGKKQDQCASKADPIAFYPSHWAPNDVMIGNSPIFPSAYRGGAFIAFHGSWNRSPAEEDGYNIVFQPMSGGRPNGQYIVFADGFAGPVKDPAAALYRPSGLALGPDGALYITDDIRGRIWRITYQGPTDARLEAAVKPPAVRPKTEVSAAPARTSPQLLLGQRIFNGEEADGTCAGCHGMRGQGSAMGPNLTSGQWQWGDGSTASIRATITRGVPAPRHFRGAMPPMGGTQLTLEQLDAVVAYVASISKDRKH